MRHLVLAALTALALTLAVAVPTVVASATTRIASATTGPGTKTHTPDARSAAATWSKKERKVVRLTNRARGRAGCRPLTRNRRLHVAADRHSRDMARRDYFSHISRDGRTPGDRMAAAGFSPLSAAGENIAMGQRTAASVMRAWLNSGPHRATIQNCTYTHIGVGLRRNRGGTTYWTQAFARH